MSCRAGPAGLRPAWRLGPSLTKFRLLQEHLGEGPANAADERGTQHQGKALDVELRGLVGEHEEASGDEENHQDQRRSLKGRETAATNPGLGGRGPHVHRVWSLGVSSHLSCPWGKTSFCPGVLDSPFPLMYQD